MASGAHAIACTPGVIIDGSGKVSLGNVPKAALVAVDVTCCRTILMPKALKCHCATPHACVAVQWFLWVKAARLAGD